MRAGGVLPVRRGQEGLSERVGPYDQPDIKVLQALLKLEWKGGWTSPSLGVVGGGKQDIQGERTFRVDAEEAILSGVCGGI